jgi:hypothetical protein
MINPLSRKASALKRAIKRVFVARGAFSLRTLASLDSAGLQTSLRPVNNNRPTQCVTLKTARRGRWVAPGRLGGTGLTARAPFHTTLAADAAQGGVARSA